MNDIEKILSGNDLRTLGKTYTLVQKIKTKKAFDRLFAFLLHQDRAVVMRAADAIEKISLSKPQFLLSHKSQLIELLARAQNKELKWHLAQLIARLQLSKEDIQKAFEILSSWMRDKNESRIVRANSMECLYELSYNDAVLQKKFMEMTRSADFKTIPSLKARLKKLVAKAPN